MPTKKKPQSRERVRVPAHQVAAETTDTRPGKGTIRPRSRFSFNGNEDQGRQSKFNSGAAQAAIDATAEGEHPGTACVIAGISSHALKMWIQLARHGSPRHIRFFRELSVARRKAESRRRKMVEAAAMGAKIPHRVTRRVEVEGKMVDREIVELMEPDAKAAQWLLEKLSRKRFGKVERVEHTGRDGTPLRMAPVVVFQGWSDEQLETYAKTGKKPTAQAGASDEVMAISAEDELEGMLDAGFEDQEE